MVCPIKEILSHIGGNLVAMASEHVPRAANTVAALLVCADHDIPIAADRNLHSVVFPLKKSADLLVCDLFWIWYFCAHFFRWVSVRRCGK